MSDAVMVPRERDEAFCEAFYDSHLTHALDAMREGIPYQINADGAFALIRQAAEDRRALKALAASTPVGGWEADRDAVAEEVHKGRFPADREPTPFADEDRSGREYCYRIADRVLALAPPPPSVSTGPRPQEAVPTEQAEPDVVDDRLHDAIRQLRQHMTTIQAAKIASAAGHPQGMGPIWNLVNALPAIVRQLDAAELDIEAAFERYEDATTPPVKTGEG